MTNLVGSGSPFAENRSLPPKIEGMFVRRVCRVTSARVTWPSAQAFVTAVVAARPAMYVAGPKAPNALFFEYRLYSRMSARAPGSKWGSGANTDTYPLRGLNWDGEYAPSVPNTIAFFPCSRSWFERVFAADATCVAKTTTFTFEPTFATTEE